MGVSKLLIEPFETLVFSLVGLVLKGVQFISMAAIDLSSWLTKQEAAQRLGVAEKTVERLIGRGKIQKQTRKVPTGRPEVVCHPGDIQRLMEAAESESATPYVMPPEGEQRSVVRKLVVDNQPALALLAELLVSQQHRSADVASKMVLTIKEAAAVSGWSQAYIERAIKEGRLQAVKDNGWKIRRSLLEQFSDRSFGPMSDRS